MEVRTCNLSCSDSRVVSSRPAQTPTKNKNQRRQSESAGLCAMKPRAHLALHVLGQLGLGDEGKVPLCINVLGG